ncbi:MAG: B12-binding domain-containing radical SAM protein [Deltaproteobacteria bacterium]|nr:B12-binding domain-containing radical SAM protein [Deltaproteobacteria bacterium]
MDVVLGCPFPRPYGIDLGLGYLATALRRNGLAVEIEDLCRPFSSPKSFAAKVAVSRPKVVGFKVWTPALGLVRKYVRAVREAVPGVQLIVGGPHVTAVGRGVFEDISSGGIDYAFRGEAEEGLPVLVREVLRGKSPRKNVLQGIPGLIWRDEGRVRSNSQSFVENLDDLGSPAWDLFDFDRYHNLKSYSLSRGGTSGISWFHVQATRGCPNHCTYCLAPRLAGSRLRKHSPGVLASQLENLRKSHGVTHVAFADDNLTQDREYALSLFSKIGGTGVSWDCTSNGVDFRTIDRELVKAMISAGCTAITFGVESGSEHVLKLMNRNYSPKDVKRAIREVRAAGNLWLESFFIIGFPGETSRDILDTLHLVATLDVDQANFNLFTPWPGIPITRKLQREGKLSEVLPSQAWYEKPTKYKGSLSPWQQGLYFVGAHVVFYSRPSRLLRILHKLGLKGVIVGVDLVLLNVFLKARD